MNKPAASSAVVYQKLCVAIVATLLFVSNTANAIEQPASVDVFIGTGGHGHTFPGATWPFGLVQLSPDTPMKGWDGCAGYHYSDSVILGFSHTHLSGTGIGDLGDVMIMSVTGALESRDDYKPLTAESLGSPFKHQNESARPGYYRVSLDRYQVVAELTATAHAGMHRYNFPADVERHIVIDLVHGVNNQPTEATLQISGDRLVTGYRSTTGWAKKRTIYFAIECSEPFQSFGLELNGRPLQAGEMSTAGKNVRAHLDFLPGTNSQILLRVGLSPTSVEEALKNLRAEIPSWQFDEVRAEAENAWSNALSAIQIESANPAISQTFYTALYHTMTSPTLYNNADGTYFGADQRAHADSHFQYYSTFSLWDIFRAEMPLLTVTQPERVNDFVQTFLAFYQQSPDHALPMWPLASFETWCMIGYHAVPVITDAYAKGFRGFDAQFAYQAMRDTATASRFHQDEYHTNGYIPAGRHKSSVARTLEFAYDDWCISKMAAALGKTEDAELFARRSQGYTNLFDPAVGFFHGKTADGVFTEPFDPKHISFDDFVEANAWHYAFAAMHDVPGMIQLYGGRDAFVKKLDQLFDEDSDFTPFLPDITGLIGQYCHGNEPCHHIAYLYALAGAQYKTALRAHQIMALHYDNTPEGICGNDDCGQMSAWYVWSAIGLYPVNPANGIYVIGSPLVEKATIQLDPKFYKGGKFSVVAHNVSNQNIYVQSAKLNGQPINRPWLTHEEITNGGELELEMGLTPSNWGKSDKP